MLNPEGGRDYKSFRLDMPRTDDFAGDRPLVFMVPSSRMMDWNGNGPEYRARDTLHAISRALISVGIATFRFAPVAGHGLDLADILKKYARVCTLPRIRCDQVGVLGVQEGADLFGAKYYDFLAHNPPAAATLLSPSVGAFELNQIRCPYLIIQGIYDPLARGGHFEEIQNAVRHHQYMRPDGTTQVRYSWLGRDLERAYVDDEVVAQVVEWFAKELRPEPIYRRAA